MGNYLNPSILIDGVANLIGKKIGWVLVGTPNGVTESLKVMLKSDGSNLPYSDLSIAGVMEPITVSGSSVATNNNNKFTLGNIGYFLPSNDPGKEVYLSSKTAATAEETTSTTAGITKIGVANLTTTTLFVKSTSGNTTILPSNVSVSNNDHRYINISNGKILLVQWKDDTNYINAINDIKGLYPDARNDTSSLKLSTNQHNFERYINKVLFAYDVSPNESKCNDYTYTGFSVGDIEVSLTGLGN